MQLTAASSQENPSWQLRLLFQMLWPMPQWVLRILQNASMPLALALPRPIPRIPYPNAKCQIER